MTKQNATLMLIIIFSMFGLSFGFSFFNNAAEANDAPETYEVTTHNIIKP